MTLEYLYFKGLNGNGKLTMVYAGAIIKLSLIDPEVQISLLKRWKKILFMIKLKILSFMLKNTVIISKSNCYYNDYWN